MWLDELAIIRRYLRDPDGKIWSEPYLRHQWNDVQRDLQTKSLVLEDVAAQRVPDLYHLSYLHDWEWQNLPDTVTEFYQCLRKHDEMVFCHSWEPQQQTSIDPDVEDLGCHFTQPWEAFMGMEPGEEIRMKFPKRASELKYIAYDEQPIYETTRKTVQSVDTSYQSRTGTPIAYYMHESLDKSYVLYPRPSTAFVDEVTGDGVAFFVEDDSEDTDVGTIAVRTGSSESGNIGASVDVVGLTNNVLMVYSVNPSEVSALTDEPDYPQFLRKYVRYGVLARAYDANTDGYIPSLAKMWAERYRVGLQVVKRYMSNRSNDRDYRLMTKQSTSRSRRRQPKLPATYPPV